MITARRMSPEELRYERAKAERANFIVSEALCDPELVARALEGLEATTRGISMLWPEFLNWEKTRHHGQPIPEHDPLRGARFEPRVAPRVRDLVANLPPEDRARFDQKLATLCANPYLDNLTRFALPYPPVVLSLYQDGPFRIIYRVVNNAVVDLLNLDTAPYVPSVSEWDDWRAS